MRAAMVVLFSLFLSVPVIAQSADQEVVSAVDSPDPVTPGATVTYTVTVRNNGPDPAVNGGLNINLPGGVTHTTDVVPAGWTCFWAGSNGTCNTPSFAPGTQVVTIDVQVNASLANFADQSINASFFPSGTTPDPNNGNNSKSAATLVDSPQVDLSVTASDSPDPVFPDGNVTYNVTATQGGPDTASTVNFNVVPNSSLAFVSSTVPAGWNCTLPGVGAINATFTCSRPTWAPGSSNFTVVFTANDEQFGINDTSFQTFFGVNAGGSHETDNPDNQVTVMTNYTTPDADVTVAVVDSPDPVAPDGNITYTVTVGNTGPDTAPNVTLNSFGANNLRFVSATVPAGWNCTLPASGTQTTSLSCNLPAGMASGGSSVLTFVMQADDALLGINDGTILFGFSANSTISDPDNTDNSETESTAYVTPDADVTVAVVDSPDPVFPDGNITYTVTVGNAGPDTAPNITLNSFGGNNLRFVSATVPAGWNCTLPASGTQTTSLTCNLPAGMVSGGNSVLTFVMQADDALLGINDGTILFGFSANSTIADPVNGNNSETESTAYSTPDANMGVAVTDSPDPVGPDGNITYTVQVTNAGPDAAPDAALNFFNNGSLRFQSISAPAGWNCTPPAVGATPTFGCTNPSFASGGSVSFTLVVQADDAILGINDGTVSTNFTVGSGAADPLNTNNSETEDTAYVTPDAELAITNADTPDPVAPGGTITYTQIVTNNGPTVANTTVAQTLPASVGFQSITNPGGFTCTTPAVGASGTITCTNASFANAATTTFTLIVTVLANSGTVTNTVVVGSPLQDTVSENNSATVITTILAPLSADLSITKTTPTTSAVPGGTVVYTITATNNGPDAATSVVVTDTLPASLLFQSISAPAGFTCTTPAMGATGTITCNAATLANAANATFTLTVTVAPNATGSIANSASVSSAVSDPNGGNSSAAAPGIVVSSADVSISKTTTATQATTGSTITYTITVTNGGPDPATNVVVTDDLPAGLQLVSATPSQGSCSGTDPFTCTLGTLANAASATITLQALVTATSGTITNTATVTATEDGNAGNNSSSTPPAPVGPTGAGAAQIPTLSEWALLALAAMLGMMALTKMR